MLISVKSLTEEQKKILDIYLALVQKKNGEYVSRGDLKEAGVPEWQLKRKKLSIEKLIDLAKQVIPDIKIKKVHTTTEVDKELKKKEVLEKYKKILISKKRSGPVTLVDLKQHKISRNQIREYWDSLSNIEIFAFESFPELFPKDFKPCSSRFSLSVPEALKKYLDLKDQLGRIPLSKELLQIEGVSKTWFSIHVGGVSEIEKAAREMYPERFNDFSIDQLRSDDNLNKLRNAVKNSKRFLITTAVTGCEVDWNFYKNLKKLAKRRNATILVLVCSDPARDKDTANKLGHVDKLLAEKELIVIEDTNLNSNLFLSTIKLTAKQMNPLTGLERIGKKHGSFIYAAPKFFLKYTSVRNNKSKLPHCIMTTGAITVPDYRSDMYMSQRTSYIAEFDHRMGAIYVEIKDDDIYHFRQVQCLDSFGSIKLDGTVYSNDGIKRIRPEAFIMGDLHIGATCPNVKSAWIDIINRTKPKRIVFHDILNGHSINHWIEKDIMARSIQSQLGLDSLEKELEMFAHELKFWASKCEEVIIVPSNHNDWLERWIRQGKYIKDPKNYYIGLCIAKAMHEGKHPLKYAIEEIFGVYLDNVNWLGRNDDYFIADVQINCHGDVGVNGSRGTLAGMENAYAASASGHSHTAGIRRDAWAVGTSTHLQEDYNNGPSTWTNTSMLIYDKGERCLYNVINGEWNDGRDY